MSLIAPSRSTERETPDRKGGRTPYATNKGGTIDAPSSPAANAPKSVFRKGDDLRK
ncbi:MAG: hypothetical protein MJ078_01430 [Clostridia bacterium]|nr:hypothetical protein [Clostridia bacterium]